MKSAATKAAEAAIECPSAFAGDQVNTYFNNFKSQTEKMLDKAKFNTVMNLETPENQGSWAGKETAVFEEYTTTQVLCIRAMGMCTPAPAVAANLPQASAPASSVIQVPEVKVPVLSLDNNPAKLRSWLLKMQSFFKTNNLSSYTTLDHQTYVRQFIDVELENMIAPQVSMTTEIFGVGGMLELIEGEFRQRYPMQARRVEYFAITWKSGDSYSKHLAKIESLAKEADLVNMSINQIQAFGLVSSVYADEKLKRKLLELENPSLKTVKQKILAYEKAIFAATIPSTSTAEERKRARCPRKSSVCNKCGRQGHLSPACMSGVPYPKKDKALTLPARAFQALKSTSSAEHSKEPETVGQNPFEYEESDFVSHVCAMEAVQSASGSRATPRINVHIRSP
ncbi:hypothetical protein TCAL_14734 [Tigriopus californicus]|uniref:CCHC-type domain-containing protein n=1 Tax=Tigriopus californicus TaxID=6832 RepID=A0A553PEX1_TIGCA|nr:hypothetical protein TCAL_14734 [Tigriopus californicus]